MKWYHALQISMLLSIYSEVVSNALSSSSASLMSMVWIVAVFVLLWREKKP